MKRWILFGLGVVLTVSGLTVSQTLPAGRPPTTRVVQLAPNEAEAAVKNTRSFVKGMEQFLAEEHKDSKKAKTVLLEISRQVWLHRIESLVSQYGIRVADMPEKQMDDVRTELVGSWAAMINFYAGYIDYSKIKAVPLINSTPESQVDTIHVILPAENPKFPRPINILVTNVQEEKEWKIKLIDLLPGK